MKAPKCFSYNCMKTPYGKCDCQANHVMFCESHALQHIEDIENNKRHRCLKPYFTLNPATRALIYDKLIEMKRVILKSRSDIIKESKEIIEAVKFSVNKALQNISSIEEKFNWLINETQNEKIFDFGYLILLTK